MKHGAKASSSPLIITYDSLDVRWYLQERYVRLYFLLIINMINYYCYYFAALGTFVGIAL